MSTYSFKKITLISVGNRIVEMETNKGHLFVARDDGELDQNSSLEKAQFF